MAFPILALPGDIYEEGGEKFLYNGVSWNRIIVQEADTLVYDPAQWALTDSPTDADAAIDSLSAAVTGIEGTNYQGPFTPSSPPADPVSPSAGDWYEVIATEALVGDWPTDVGSPIADTTAMNEGDKIRYTGTVWLHVEIGAGSSSTTLDALTDTTLSGEAVGDFLRIASISPTDWQNTPLQISHASDVDTSGVLDEYLLQYDAGAGEWVPIPISTLLVGGFSITNLSDVSVTVDDNTGTFFVFDGTNFVPSKASAGVAGEIPYYAGSNAFAHLAPPGDSNDYALSWDGSAYSWSSITSVLPDGATNDLLYYNGSAWDTLGIGAADTYLKYNGSNLVWAVAAGGGGATEMVDLSDVDWVRGNPVPIKYDILTYSNFGGSLHWDVCKRPSAGVILGEKYWFQATSDDMSLVNVPDYYVPWGDENPGHGLPGAMGYWDAGTEKLEWSPAPSDGSLYYWDDGANSLAVLTPTTSDDTLKWNGSAWVRVPFTLASLADVNIVGFGAEDDGKAVTYNNASGKFVGTTIGDMIGPGSSTAKTVAVFSTTDGVTTEEFLELTKDGTDLSLSTSFKCDTINEYTGAAGVTIDGVLLKDGGLTATGAFAGDEITCTGITCTDSYLQIAGLAESPGAFGGRVVITGGIGGSGATDAGGLVGITGGEGGTDGSSPGGFVILTGGAGGTPGGDGGNITLTGGRPVEGAGGSVIIRAGDGVGTNQDAGDVTIRPGLHSGSGDPGRLELQDTAGTALLVIDDTALQLATDLDVSGNSIVSISAGDIAITPDTTGSVILDGLSWPQADGAGGEFLQTDGAGNLTFANAMPDDVFRVVDNSDTTKELMFQLSGITTGTTRTWTVPDADWDLGAAKTKLDAIEASADVTDATNVAAAGAHMSGGTDVPVADGGTGASTAAAARTNLGVGLIASDQATVTVTNSVAWTTLIDETVPANALGTDGGVKCVIGGYWTNNSGSGDTLQIRITFGSTVLYEETSRSAGSTSVSRGLRFEFELFNKNDAAIQELMGFIVMNNDQPATTGTGGWHGAYAQAAIVGIAGAEDTTGALNFKVELKMTTAHASNTFTKRSAYLAYI